MDDDAILRLLGGQAQPQGDGDAIRRLLGEGVAAPERRTEPVVMGSEFERDVASIPEGVGKVARTALVGSAPGAATARGEVTGTAFPTLDALYRGWMPKFAQRAIEGIAQESAGPVPEEGISPTYEQIRQAAMRDPRIGRSYYDAWLTAKGLKAQAEDPNTVANKTIAGKLPQRREIPGMPLEFGAGGADLYSTTPEEAKAQNERYRAAGTPKEIGKKVFTELSAEAAVPEYRLQAKHPWMAATSEIPGETVRMGRDLAISSLTGPAAPLTFDALSQAQRINAGGQEGWSPEQSAVNLLGQFGGGFMGRSLGNRMIAKGFEAKTAERAAALLSNAVMTGTPTAVEAAKSVAAGDKLDWGALARSLYKGVAEAGALSAIPHISPARPNYEDPLGTTPQTPPEARVLARERANAMASGDTAIHDTLAKVEEAIRARGGKEPEAATEAPEGEANAANAVKSAQDAVLRAATEPETLKSSRAQHEEAIRRGMKPDAEPKDTALFDAMMSLKADMVNEPPESAARLHFGSDEYTGRLSDQFGLDESQRKMLREYGADLILEPHKKFEEQGGFARVRLTEEEKAAENEKLQTINREHQRVVAEAPEKIRQLVNKAFSKLTGRTDPLITRDDPGLAAHQAKEGLRIREMALKDRLAQRAVFDLYKMAPGNEATMDRLFTLVAEDPTMEPITRSNLPEPLRAPFDKALELYRGIAKEHADVGLELGVFPQSIHEERGFTPSGEIIRQDVTTPAGGKYEGSGKLVGGVEKYGGKWVHHEFRRSLRKDLPPFFGGERRTNQLERILGADVPSSFRRRTKGPEEFLEQGNVSIEPSFREMADQRRAFRIRSDLDYLRDQGRTDLYRTKSQMVGDVESQAAIDIAHANERLPENKKEFRAHRDWMMRNSIPIFAGESGPLTREMQANRARVSKRLHEQIQSMGERKIPINGMPEGFDPNPKHNRRRATEIRREQAKYQQLQKQVWTHLRVERPDELFGTKADWIDQKTFDANMKLRELFDERIVLENQLKSTWIELKGKAKYGDRHEGNYVNSNALRQMEIAQEANEVTPNLYLEMSKTFKFMRVAGNWARSFIMQFNGNTLTTQLGGVQFTRKGLQEWITAGDHIVKYLWSQGREHINDPIFQKLLDSGRIAGPLVLYDVPQVLKESVASAMAEARKELDTGSVKRAARLYTAAMLRAMRYYPGEIPVFGRGIQMVSAMDLIPMYGMLRQLVTGNGSLMGTMHFDDALTHTGYLYDQSAVPRWVNRVASNNKWYKVWPTFARWLYKGTVGPAVWMMASPPTLAPYPIPFLRTPQPFGEYIAANPGTPGATKRIWAAKAINLVANATKVIAHIAVAGRMSASLAGFDPDSEDFKRRRLAAAGGDHVRAFLMLTVGDKDGEPVFQDPMNITPMTGPFTLGNEPSEKEDPSQASRILHWLLSLNWITNAGTHILERTDFSGHKISFGQAVIESAKNFLPGAFEMPASAAYNATRPWSRKSVGEALFQAFSGLRIVPSSPMDEENLRMLESQRAGDIEYIKQPVPLTPKGTMDLRIHNAMPEVMRRQHEAKIRRLLEREK